MFEIQSVDDATIAVSGEVKMRDMNVTRKRLEREIKANKTGSLALDMSGLKTFNSAVVSMLLCLIREANRSGCQLVFRELPQGILDMARVGGLQDILVSQS